MSTPTCPFLATGAGEGQPLTVRVLLTPSDEVVLLRDQVKELQAQVLTLKSEAARAQNLYQRESILNLELVDLCRAHGVPVRDALDSHKRGR